MVKEVIAGSRYEFGELVTEASRDAGKLGLS